MEAGILNYLSPDLNHNNVLCINEVARFWATSFDKPQNFINAKHLLKPNSEGNLGEGSTLPEPFTRC